LTAAAESFIEMDNTSKPVWRTDSGGGRTKQPLAKTRSLLPDVKAQLNSALSDMKKSVINVKKSPWLLTRSSTYSNCCRPIVSYNILDFLW